MQPPAKKAAKRTPKKRPERLVTDHALVRYFERVLRLDVEAIRETILTAAQVQQIKAGMEQDIKLAPGVTAVVRGQKVVTIK